MGGTFSGCRGSKKRVVESCDALDTANLKRWGMLIPGTDRAGVLDWRHGGEKKPSSTLAYTLAVGTDNGVLRLVYRIGQPAESLDYAIQLVTTRCHLGGLRWWFICPLVRDRVACERRVRKLYRCGKYFGCRHCHNLAYRSTQESDSRVYAALRRGAHLHEFGDIRGMSVSQLGLALKVLTAGQKRFDRLIARGPKS
ncbi:hypothetical protein J8F10_15865 [Gemmata sp. G18]|uniref:DUF3795 domain-containing protein n=1 Tax=Gemmata palustris TaxID=2822762 RepID=A0ABS5BSS5_9BACT|nr:hypothetical protein [Gemmata palustris]MBP3956749.1 hypothetical protein [Gemmata palustris]